MKTIKMNQTIPGLMIMVAIVSMVAFSSCESNGEVESKGQATIGITDAAIDAENISGVYLNVSEVQATANGNVKTIATFDAPREFNVMAYQNGEVYALGSGEIEAGSYDELRLVLSETAASYIKYEDGTERELEIPSGTTSGYKIKGDFEVAANNTTDLVVDIDLRKALVTTGESTFILRPTARLVVEESTGTIKGSVNTMTEGEIKVVYAYPKGAFDDSESDDPAQGQARFENSINSAVVAEDGSFTLAFMEEGEYDLIISTYEKNEQEETFEFESETKANFMINGSLASVVKVESSSTINLLISLGQ